MEYRSKNIVEKNSRTALAVIQESPKIRFQNNQDQREQEEQSAERDTSSTGREDNGASNDVKPAENCEKSSRIGRMREKYTNPDRFDNRSILEDNSVGKQRSESSVIEADGKGQKCLV